MKIEFRKFDGESVYVDVNIETISLAELRAVAAAALGEGWTAENTRLIMAGRMLSDSCERHSHQVTSSTHWRAMAVETRIISARVTTSVSPVNNVCSGCEREKMDSAAYAARREEKDARRVARQAQRAADGPHCPNCGFSLPK